MNCSNEGELTIGVVPSMYCSNAGEPTIDVVPTIAYSAGQTQKEAETQTRAQMETP